MKQNILYNNEIVSTKLPKKDGKTHISIGIYKWLWSTVSKR